MPGETGATWTTLKKLRSRSFGTDWGFQMAEQMKRTQNSVALGRPGLARDASPGMTERARDGIPRSGGWYPNRIRRWCQNKHLRSVPIDFKVLGVRGAPGAVVWVKRRRSTGDATPVRDWPVRRTLNWDLATKGLAKEISVSVSSRQASVWQHARLASYTGEVVPIFSARWHDAPLLLSQLVGVYVLSVVVRFITTILI